METVIILESPNKVKKLQPMFPDVKVIATVGHIMDLPLKTLGLDLSTYRPEFTPILKGSQKDRDMTQLLRGFCKGKNVFIASDPDREGYAIGRHVYEAIRGLAGPIFRAEIREISKKGVQEALDAAVPWEKTNHGLYDAFLGRRVADRLCGYIESPKASNALGETVSVGRVQSPATRLVVDREREIAAFVSKPFWNLFVELEEGGQAFKAQCLEKNMQDQAKALELENAVKAANKAALTKLEQKETQAGPAAPFTTVSLQATANARLGLPPEKTMKLAQALFEAGLITYHRTDSVRIAPEFIQEIRELVAHEFGPQFVPREPATYKSANSQADAHEAIRPTHVHEIAEIERIVTAEGLGPEAVALYELIFKRTVASQMAKAVFFDTKAVFDVAGIEFIAKGRVLKFAGFKALYGEDPEEDEAAEQDGRLPEMKQGAAVTKTGQVITQGKTQPPGRFTEGSLVKELEKRGIGRPSTFASIMSTIKARGYVEVRKGKLFPTAKGNAVVDYLAKASAWIVDYDFTKDMEAFLDDVEAGRKTWTEFVKTVHAKMDYASPAAFNVKSQQAAARPGPERVGACPRCKGDVLEFPKAYTCKCGLSIYRESYGHQITTSQARQLLEKGRTRQEVTLKARSGDKYKAFLVLDGDGKVRWEKAGKKPQA